MSNQNNTLPIGKLLQAAGLISREEFEKALEIQSQYTSMKLGEILVLQETIKRQTAIFFGDRWSEIKEEGKQFPIGYYLKNAGLLNEEQIQTILEEQKINRLKFGVIAVQKGWLKQQTIDFFLDGLSSKPPRLMSLIYLEKYDREVLHLDRKYINSSLILSRILAWTGGNTNLTKDICHVFADSDLNIPEGMEITAVDRLIEGSIIRNWQTSKLGTHIRAIRENLIDNQNCKPISLLTEYQEILLSGSKEYRQTKEQQELLTLGLVVVERNQLRVTNLIYQQVFNQDWLVRSKERIKSQKIEENKIIPSQIEPINTLDRSPQSDRFQPIDEEPEIKVTEPLTKFSSLLILSGIILLIPLFLAINSYYSSKPSQKANSNLSKVDKLKKTCNEVNLIEPASALSSISQLEKSKQKFLKSFPKTLEVFPDNCETALNRLRVLAAPQLGKENRVIEAIKHLCQIPSDSESINEAQVWIENWSNSASWGSATKTYLDLVNHCPAGDR